MKIVVLAGGLSPERDVSLASGSLISNALIDNGHKVLLLDLYKGQDYENPDHLFIDSNMERRYQYTVPSHEPDLEALKLETNSGDSLIGKNVIEICKSADIVFFSLHGSIGENGQLQAVFDSLGIRYTGTGYIGSLLAMDKDIAKQLMSYHKILTPAWITLPPMNGTSNAGTWSIHANNNDLNLAHVLDKIGLPCVIKPCSCGSSIGVSILRSEDDINHSIDLVKKYEDRIMIEKMISGREFSVGILDSKALPVIEILPNTGFYDYKNKYQSGLTKEICPAPLSDELTQRLQNEALKVHEVLRLGHYARIDFIMDESGDFYCLEANTLPGMTPTSLLPQEAAAMGIPYNQLCEKIVMLALGRV